MASVLVGTLIVLCALSWLLVEYAGAVHTRALWIRHGNHYRSAVLSQAPPPSGQLKHIEWDGWGWGGQDTTVYLVFDPNDALAAAAKSEKPGLYPGLPCEVHRVRRLQAHWYSVEFYTTSIWTDCGFSKAAH